MNHNFWVTCHPLINNKNNNNNNNNNNQHDSSSLLWLSFKMVAIFLFGWQKGGKKETIKVMASYSPRELSINRELPAYGGFSSFDGKSPCPFL